MQKIALHSALHRNPNRLTQPHCCAVHKPCRRCQGPFRLGRIIIITEKKPKHREIIRFAKRRFLEVSSRWVSPSLTFDGHKPHFCDVVALDPSINTPLTPMPARLHPSHTKKRVRCVLQTWIISRRFMAFFLSVIIESSGWRQAEGQPPGSDDRCRRLA